MAAICIERMDFENQNLSSGDNQEGSEFVVLEPERGLTHGSFNSMDFPSVEAAQAAAESCLAQFTKNPWVSPFARHQKVLSADHGGAIVIARLVLSLYKGSRYPWDASSLRLLDRKFLNIAMELMTSYHQYRQHDADFVAISEQLELKYSTDVDSKSACSS